MSRTPIHKRTHGLIRAVALAAGVLAGAPQPAHAQVFDTGFNANVTGSSGTGIDCLALQSDGKVLIGGSFETVNGVARLRLARLLADGSLDLPFTTSVTAGGTVMALAVQPDGRILVGGDFTGLRGEARNRLARLMPDGTLDPSFAPTINLNGGVTAIVILASGKILIGGVFTQINGVARVSMARLNTDGTVDPAFAPTIETGPLSGNSIPFRIALQPDGLILISGRIAKVNGVARNYLARLNADGSLDSAFNPNPNAWLHAIAVRPDGRILVGGTFTNIGGDSRNYLAQLQADGTLDPAFNPNANSFVYALALQADGKLLAAGRFLMMAAQPVYLVARLLTSGAPDSTFGPFPQVGGGDISALALQPDGKVLVGGHFASTTSIVNPNMARLYPNAVLVSLDKTSLQFAATTAGTTFTQQTQGQVVRLLQTGGTVAWTATPSQPWITVSPAAGTGSSAITIGVQFASGVPASGTISGSVSLTVTGAGNTVGPVTVVLRTISNGGTPPSGAFDTPTEGATGITGSIAVTGWAIDDVEVRAVRILRDPVAGEGSAQIFIGNAVFVDGARPDIANGNPTAPRNTRAGWGYLMLTNFLPNQGNGTFKIYAYADDAEGRTTLLGTRTITCTNNTATKPFGAIDTPGQGEVVGGANYANFGWVLARGTTRADPPSGGTVTAYIDGVPIGTPGGWVSRSDLTALFPATTYAGVGSALGVMGLNTTLLTNGVHTIFWVVTASNGQTDGVGSRYFTVANGSSLRTSTGLVGVSQVSSPGLTIGVPSPSALRAQDVDALSRDVEPLNGRRGFDLLTPLQLYAPGPDGLITIHGEELDRFELQVGRDAVGYVRTADALASLPIGSHLDPVTGVFTWQPGVGFVHAYDLVFVRSEAGGSPVRRELRIVLHPKGSNRTGPQVTIDAPASAKATAVKPVDVAQPFGVAGWAIDVDGGVGTGVDAVHVWAYPAGGGEPVFLGAAAYGGQRPDVGAIFGDRFTRSGYGLIVDDLAPGTYDLAVFAWSTALGRFAPATVTRVTVR